jgi:hypothetical protein
MYEPVPLIDHDPDVAEIDIADSSGLLAPVAIQLGSDNKIGPVPVLGQPGIVEVGIPKILVKEDAGSLQ